MEKEELLLEVKEKTTAIVIKEFSPSGAKIQYNSMGEVKGKYSGAHIETTDVLQKMDGTYDWASRAIETTKEGDTLLVSGNGTGRQAIGSTIGTLQGESTCITNSQRLSWLNNTKVKVEGTFDSRKNEINLKVFAEKQTVETPAQI